MHRARSNVYHQALLTPVELGTPCPLRTRRHFAGTHSAIPATRMLPTAPPAPALLETRNVRPALHSATPTEQHISTGLGGAWNPRAHDNPGAQHRHLHCMAPRVHNAPGVAHPALHMWRMRTTRVELASAIDALDGSNSHRPGNPAHKCLKPWAPTSVVPLHTPLSLHPPLSLRPPLPLHPPLSLQGGGNGVAHTCCLQEGLIKHCNACGLIIS